MNNRYYEPFDNNTNTEGSQTPAYRTEQQQTAYTQNTGYAPHQRRYANPCNASHEPKGRKKKTKKSAGFVAGTVAACVMMSGVAGFGGSYLFSKMNSPANNTSAVQILRDVLHHHKTDIHANCMIPDNSSLDLTHR